VTYNGDGRRDTVIYPSGLSLKYSYNAFGYVSKIADLNTGTVYWIANSRDAELHLAQTTAANGVVTNKSFDPNTGLISVVQAGTATNPSSLDTWSYSFDTVGNLTSRSDASQSATEQFCYDSLNRLTNYAVGATCTSTGSTTIGYDPIGDITAKSDVGNYSYPSSGGATPHAVSSITGVVNGVTNPTYTYDANGSMISGANRAITYTSYNMTSSISQGSTSDSFTYDAEHRRITSNLAGVGVTTYLDGLDLLSENLVNGSAATWHDYISADGRIVAEKDSGATVGMRYFVLDNLDSIVLVTDNLGAVSERDSFDAWGLRRNANWTPASCGTVSSVTTRGFTNQEQIDPLCLVNLNARLYDPVVGAFMVPDLLEDVYEPQNLNRFSYAEDGPTYRTDQTGNCPWCVAAGIGAAENFGIEVGLLWAEKEEGQYHSWSEVDKRLGGAIVVGGVAGASGYGLVALGAKAEKTIEIIRTATEASKALRIGYRAGTVALGGGTTNALVSTGRQQIDTGHIDIGKVADDARTGAEVGGLTGGTLEMTGIAARQMGAPTIQAQLKNTNTTVWRFATGAQITVGGYNDAKDAAKKQPGPHQATCGASERDCHE
jgi:RHS repeat-associated protein